MQISLENSCTGTGTWSISWGDGSTNTTFSSNYDNDRSHSYASNGDYTTTLTYTCSVGSQATRTLAITASDEALSGSFHTLTYGNGRIWVRTQSDFLNTSAKCSVSGVATDQPCAIGTDVSFITGANQTYTVSATFTLLGYTDFTFSTILVVDQDGAAATATPTPIPLSASWGGSDPFYYETGDLVFFTVNSVPTTATIVCSIPAISGNAGQVTCISGVRSSIDVSSLACGNIEAKAVASLAGANDVTLTKTVIKPCPVDPPPVDPPPPVDTPTPTPSPLPPPVNSGDSGRSRSSSSSSSSRSQRQPDPRPTRDRSRLPIPTQDHSQLPVDSAVSSHSPWIQMREVTGAGIGQQSLIDAGARAAIDVWSPLPLEAEVCFPGMGSLLLLDAAYSPRLQVPLTSYLSNGMTCTLLDRAGTVVLMPGMPSIMPTEVPPPTAIPTPTRNPYLIADDLSTMRTLEGCMVRTFELLNFRASPAGRRLSWYSGTSEAVARTRNWFKVEYMGQVGWVSAHFVSTSGDCR